MDEQKFSLSGSFKKAKEYVDTQLELLKLRAISRVSRMLGALIVDVAKVVLLLIIVFFLALALGFYLGEVLGSNALGFLTTGGIFLLILLIVRAFERKIESAFMNLAVRKFYNNWNEEEDNTSSVEQNNTNEEAESIIQQEKNERKDQ